MNQIATQQQVPATRERLEVIDAVPILDTSRFEHMQRVASVMARSTLMPESLYMVGKKDAKEELPYEQILSNCFLVVNQAVRWGLDPFAVAQCVSVVHGKLCYEGKLVSAVLQAKMGMNLYHHLTGEGEAMRVYLSDKPFTEKIIGELKPGYRRQDMRIFDGSVNEWKTTGAGTPWTPKNFPRMLIYRGTRDWCRIYEPALMLGVYTDDEMIDMETSTRSRHARDITPKPSLSERLKQPSTATESATSAQEGFDATAFDQSEETAPVEDYSDFEDTGDVPSLDEPVSDAAQPPSRAASEDGGAPLPSPSSSLFDDEGDEPKATDEEITKLRRYAKDVLNRAGDPNTSAQLMKTVEARWAEDINPMSEPAKAIAGSIARSVRAIMKGEVDMAKAIEFHSEGLLCDPAELEADHG